MGEGLEAAAREKPLPSPVQRGGPYLWDLTSKDRRSPVGVRGRARRKVVTPPGHQVAPAVALRVVQRETVPGECHELGRDAHLQADEAGARGPRRVIQPRAELPVPPAPDGDARRSGVWWEDLPTPHGHPGRARHPGPGTLWLMGGVLASTPELCLPPSPRSPP